MRDADKQYLAQHYYDYFRIALAILQDTEEAKDAVQEALAETMSRTLLRDANAYCRKVLRNYCTDRLKERYQLLEITEELKSEEPDSLHEERLRLMNKVRSQLSEKDIELLDMLFEQGMTIEEVATTTGRTYTWVKRHKHQVLVRMRKLIIYEEYKQTDI